MDVLRLNANLQNLKDQLKNLFSVSTGLIERNSMIDSGVQCDTSTPAPKFELILEDFLSSCNSLELNLRTIQECLQQSRASSQNLPITLHTFKCDNLDGRIEQIEPNSTVSYNQYLSVVGHQVEAVKDLKAILEEFANKCNQHHQHQTQQSQPPPPQPQLQHQHLQQQQPQQHIQQQHIQQHPQQKIPPHF